MSTRCTRPRAANPPDRYAHFRYCMRPASFPPLSTPLTSRLASLLISSLVGLSCASVQSPYADIEPCGPYQPGPKPTEEERRSADFSEPELIGSLDDLRDRIDLDTTIPTGGKKLISELDYLIDITGCVREIRVTRNDHQSITDAFVRGIAASRFRPATLDGERVEVIQSRGWSWQTRGR
jgi:hypothetical protein